MQMDGMEPRMEDVTDIPHSTLIGLLTEKANELKVVNRKLKKAEDQYAQLHHQRAALHKDKEVYKEFFAGILNKDIATKIADIEPGQLTIEDLRAHWELVGKDKMNENQDLVSQLKEEKDKLAQKIVDLSSKLTETETLRTDLQLAQAEIANLKHEVSNLTEKSNEATTELKEVKEKQEAKSAAEQAEIKEKTEKIEELTTENEVLATNLAEKENTVAALEVELEHTKQQSEAKASAEKEIKEDANNRVQKLYHELLESKQKAGKLLASKEKEIMELRVHIASLKQQKQDLHTSMSREHSFPPAASPSSYSSRVTVEESKEPEKGKQESSSLTRCDQDGLERFVDKEYMQCVIFNYLRALTEGNKMRIGIVEEILTAAVDLPKDRKDELDDLRSKSAFWNYIWTMGEKAIGAVSYYIKGPGEENDGQGGESRLTGFGSHT